VIHTDFILTPFKSITAGRSVFHNSPNRTINHLASVLIGDEVTLDRGLRWSCVESFGTYSSNGNAWPAEQTKPDPIFVIAARERMREQSSRRGGEQRAADARSVLEGRRARERHPGRQCRWEQTDLLEAFRCLNSGLGIPQAGERTISKIIEKQM
jgi:hypothetical protein